MIIVILITLVAIGFIIAAKKDKSDGSVSSGFTETIDVQIPPSASSNPLAREIAEAKGDEERLRLCRQAMKSFIPFIRSSFEQDGWLPPSVPVRDYGPEMLMRFGEWKEAEDLVQTFIFYKAYGRTEYRDASDSAGHWVAESGENELQSVRVRHAAADAALAYLAENPGTLQSKIYKIPALSSVDHNALVWFCRSSHQIRKEPDGKTNRLYVAGGDSP